MEHRPNRAACEGLLRFVLVLVPGAGLEPALPMSGKRV